MKKPNSIFRFFFWAALLALGFFAGSSWKESDTTQIDPKLQEAVDKESAAITATPSEAKIRTIAPRSGLKPDEKATISLFENAAPSVTFITTSNIRRDYFTMDAMEIPRGTGSGFIWDKKGHIVTNYHVISGADRAIVTLADQSTWPAKLVGKAPEKDLAVLKIEAPAKQLLPILTGTSEDLLVGQSVYAIGNPFGLDQTLTTGIISALGREIQSQARIPIRDAIQTDAAINPGNSGGPLLDSSGRLIGVNTAIYSPSGAYAGIGFSVPVDIVNWVIPDLIKFGKVIRPVLGVEFAADHQAQRLGLEGILVLKVLEESPADRAGIKATYRNRDGSISLGDIIVGINNEKIALRNDLILTLEKYRVGDKITVQVQRDAETVDIPLILDASQ